jgi:hypothetical protein
MTVDPLSALVDLINGWRKESHIQQWCKLIFQLVTSMIGSFLIVCGTGLVGGVTVARCIGSGMCVAAVAMYMILRRSDLTKGMLFVAPPQEGKLEIEGDMSVIVRNK